MTQLRKKIDFPLSPSPLCSVLRRNVQLYHEGMFLR